MSGVTDLLDLLDSKNDKPLAPAVTAESGPRVGMNIGQTYVHGLDFDRLSNGRKRGLFILVDGKPHSNVELNRSPLEGGAGLEGTRRIRELSGPVWGPFDIERWRDDHGIWWYQLRLDSLTDRILDKVYLDRPDPVLTTDARRSAISAAVRKASPEVLARVEAALGISSVEAAATDVPFAEVDPQDVDDAVAFLDDDG